MHFSVCTVRCLECFGKHFVKLTVREPPEESILIIDWEVQHAPGLSPVGQYYKIKHIRKRIPKRSIQAQELE